MAYLGALFPWLVVLFGDDAGAGRQFDVFAFTIATAIAAAVGAWMFWKDWP